MLVMKEYKERAFSATVQIISFWTFCCSHTLVGIELELNWRVCIVKYKIITLIGNKLRKQGFNLSIQLFGSLASTQVHGLLTDEDNLVVGKETGIEFYDRDVGDILSCKLFYETTQAGTDLYVEKIAVQRYIYCFLTTKLTDLRSQKMVKDLSEITLKWGKRQLFKINEWIKPYQASAY